MKDTEIIVEAMIRDRWQQAKGILRSLSELRKSTVNSRYARPERYERNVEIDGYIEKFIKYFEEEDYETL